MAEKPTRTATDDLFDAADSKLDAEAAGSGASYELFVSTGHLQPAAEEADGVSAGSPGSEQQSCPLSARVAWASCSVDSVPVEQQQSQQNPGVARKSARSRPMAF